MKTGKNFLQNFFIKEPKFSVLIALLAIIMLIVFYFSVDTESMTPFSGQEIKMEYPALDIPLEQVIFF